jgi:hypothetical protein
MPPKNTYTALETALLPTFAAALAASRHKADVEKYFAYAVMELLHGVLADTSQRPDVLYEDIALTPHAPPGYALGTRLTAQPALAQALSQSELPAILARLAETATERLDGLAETIIFTRC